MRLPGPARNGFILVLLLAGGCGSSTGSGAPGGGGATGAGTGGMNGSGGSAGDAAVLSGGSVRARDAAVARPDSEAGGSGPTPAAGPCDPKFTGPFCTTGTGGAQVLLGLDAGPPLSNPTPAEVRGFSLAAVNAIRARTCLPPLTADTCLDDIGTRANAAVPALGVHGYFIQNCENAAHSYGKNCECGWTQENYGAASGSSRTWKDGIIVPLCAMMQEPKGTGHRGNIESVEWKRLGVGADVMTNGASWCHEFGN